LASTTCCQAAKQYMLQKINALIASSSNQFPPRDILQKLTKSLLGMVLISYIFSLILIEV
jgi:hypothetical protein